jgi:alpha-1,2-mannosyltransferase
MLLDTHLADGHTATRARRILIAAICLAALLSLGEATLNDTAVYWEAGRRVLGGGNVYGFTVGKFGFTYPPFSALVIGSVAWVPQVGLWCLFNLLSLLSLVTVLRLCAPADFAVVRRGGTRAALRLSSFVLALPVTETFRFGQVDLMLLALVLLDLLVYRRGVLLGLATAIKLTPGLFVVYLVLQRRYREAAMASGVFVAAVTVSAIVLPGGSRTYWLHSLEDGSGIGGFDGARNQSLHGLALRAFGAHLGASVWIATALPATVIGLVLAQRVARSSQQLLAVSVVGLTGCLISPLSWNHHWVWALPALAGLYAINHTASQAFRRWLVGVSTMLVLWSVLPTCVQTWSPLHVVGTALVPVALITAGWRVTLAVRFDRRQGQLVSR